MGKEEVEHTHDWKLKKYFYEKPFLYFFTQFTSQDYHKCKSCDYVLIESGVPYTIIEGICDKEVKKARVVLYK